MIFPERARVRGEPVAQCSRWQRGQQRTEFGTVAAAGQCRTQGHEELRTLALANCSCNASMQALIMAEEYHARLLAFIDEIRAGAPE